MDSQDGGLVLMMKSIMIMTIYHQAHTRQTAVHHIIQVVVMEAVVIHQRAILPENTIVVAHQEAVQILQAAVQTAIAIPVALHIQEALQAAAPVQRNIIMIHTMMVMMMSTWMETMMMTDTTAMMIMQQA